MALKLTERETQEGREDWRVEIGWREEVTRRVADLDRFGDQERTGDVCQLLAYVGDCCG